MTLVKLDDETYVNPEWILWIDYDQWFTGGERPVPGTRIKFRDGQNLRVELTPNEVAAKIRGEGEK